jgi:hypothetical protein
MSIFVSVENEAVLMYHIVKHKLYLYNKKDREQMYLELW